jgi:hypothetical protein
MRAELFHFGDLALGVRGWPELRRRTAAATCQVRDRGKRRSGGSETGDQLAKSDGPDSGRADQPQPVD